MMLGKRLLLITCLVGSAGHVHAEGDAAKGKTLFSRCTACHATGNQNKVGPGLAGIVGRPAARVPGFRYSKAMMGSGLTWTEEKLDTYLGGLRRRFPGRRWRSRSRHARPSSLFRIAAARSLSDSLSRNRQFCAMTTISSAMILPTEATSMKLIWSGSTLIRKFSEKYKLLISSMLSNQASTTAS